MGLGSRRNIQFFFLHASFASAYLIYGQLTAAAVVLSYNSSHNKATFLMTIAGAQLNPIVRLLKFNSIENVFKLAQIPIFLTKSVVYVAVIYKWTAAEPYFHSSQSVK